jgi:hypothetical protein
MLRIIGFRMGEAITKDITGPKGAPAFKKPRVMGMVEQAQKGVRAPIRAPRRFPMIPCLDSQFFSFSWGMYMRRIPTRVLMPRKRSVSSALMNAKYSKVFVNVFILWFLKDILYF